MKILNLFILGVFPVLVISFSFEICSISNTFLSFNMLEYSNYNDWISICFTSGSIVLAIQSFLVPFMHQSLYSTRDYKSYLQAEYKENWQKEQFRPLKNLAEFLFLTTTSAFSSILFMIWFIFVKNICIISLAFYFGFTSFVGLLMALYAMRSNFNIMFTYKDTKTTK